SYFFASLGLLLSTQSWLIGGIAIAYVVVSQLRVKKEERMLLEEFGDAYVRYVASTRLRQREFVRCAASSIFLVCHAVGMLWELAWIVTQGRVS
ncbi:hypothetical protein C0581_02645, partial [Candidatus Parcubacteria bacterium]